jgi:PAS domain S-box-containing protein
MSTRGQPQRTTEDEVRAARREGEQTRARLDAVLASSEDAILCVDRDWIVITWNGAAERLFGRPAADIVGRPLTPLIPADYQPPLAAVQAALARGEAVPPQGPLRVF